MDNLQRKYRVLVSVWPKGDTTAIHYKFKTENYEDQGDLVEDMTNFAISNIEVMEEDFDNNDGTNQGEDEEDDE